MEVCVFEISFFINYVILIYVLGYMYIAICKCGEYMSIEDNALAN